MSRIPLLTPVLIAAAAAGQNPGPPPTPAALLQALRAAHKAHTLEEKIAPLKQAVAVPDAKVARAVAAFASDPVDEVSLQAVQTLRFMKHGEALKQLMALASRRPLRKREELFGEVLLALGQHGDERAIPAILDHFTSSNSKSLMQQRIAALTHIRSKASIAALMKMAHSSRRGKRAAGGGRVRVAEAVYLLSGKRFGSQGELETWWNEVRRSARFKVAATPKWLTKKERQRWDRAWSPAEKRSSKKDEKRDQRAAKKRAREGKGQGPPGSKGGGEKPADRV